MFVLKVTRAPCRERFYIRVKCLSRTTGSVSTPKSLAGIPRLRSSPQLRPCCSRVRRRDMSMFPNHQVSIPVPSVTFIKKTKTALLVPNALVIGMASCQVREPRRSFPTFHVNKLNSANVLCFSAHVCVLPVPKHNLQISEVCLSSFGGICLIECFHLNLRSGSLSCSAVFSIADMVAYPSRVKIPSLCLTIFLRIASFFVV